MGTYPETRLADARYEAAQYATGALARRLRAARIPTLEQATEDYLARPKLRSEHNKNQVRGQMHNHLTEWLSMPLNEITKADCVRAHARIAKKGERGVNHVLKSFRSVYNHARRVHDLDECPTIAIEWFAEEPSQRIITDLPEWKRVVDDLENPIHTAFFRLLLTTGLRKTEALSLRWDQVRDDHLHLPETKNGRAFNLPFLSEHHAILSEMPAIRSDYVFPGKRDALHMKEPIRIPWTAHDHRRTFATFATTEAGLLEETVGRLLNHTPQSVTGSRYIVVDHQKLREPMEQIISAFKRKDLI